MRARVAQKVATGAGSVEARLTDRVALVTLLLVGVLLALPGAVIHVSPNSDGLFYEQHALQLQGVGHDEAVRRIFDGPRAREAAQIYDMPLGEVRILDPRWVAHSEQFFDRRWFVPALAAGYSSATGASVGRGMQVSSMLGYALAGIVIFLLLRCRFDLAPSFAGGVSVLLLPPLYRWSAGSFVDSWGVVLESLGLLGLVLVADRGRRWLALWIGAMLMLSITRDATLLLGISAALLLVRQARVASTRGRNLALVVSGALAALPAAALGGVPLRVFVTENAGVAHESGFGVIVRAYWHQLRYTARADLRYPADHAGPLAPLLYAGLVLITGLLVAVALRRSRGDAFWIAMHGCLLGSAAVLLLANNPQGFRLELVLVPAIGTGVALAASWGPVQRRWSSLAEP